MKPQEVELYAKLLAWLGYDGVAFFQMCVDTYGGMTEAVWSEGGIPHAIHFREGMQVRNFLRGFEYLQDWDAHDFDNKWGLIVMNALVLCESMSKKKGGE